MWMYDTFSAGILIFVKLNFKDDIIDKILGICSEQMDVQCSSSLDIC